MMSDTAEDGSRQWYDLRRVYLNLVDALARHNFGMGKKSVIFTGLPEMEMTRPDMVRTAQQWKAELTAARRRLVVSLGRPAIDTNMVASFIRETDDIIALCDAWLARNQPSDGG
jgi:hypothetical protein